MWGSIIYFVAVSLPEQFLMALFTWLILGKHKTAKFYNVVAVGISAAALFRISQVVISALFGATNQAVLQGMLTTVVRYVVS